jgi:hypothetical protein
VPPQHVELNVDGLNVDMVAGWKRCLQVNTATPTAASSDSSCCGDGVADVITNAAGMAKAAAVAADGRGLLEGGGDVELIRRASQQRAFASNATTRQSFYFSIGNGNQ